MDANDVLARLARHLADEALAAAVPDVEPAAVRRLLLQAARQLASDNRPARPAAGDNGETVPKTAGRFRLYTDGAARGNPGEAGAGFCLFDPQGRELFGHGCYLGQCTNNVAEYRALELGLTKALELGIQDLEICLDSELVVKQLRGEYRVKNAGLQPLYQRVRQLLGQLASWQLRHVPRRDNARADELANQGIDDHLGAAASGTTEA